MRSAVAVIALTAMFCGDAALAQRSRDRFGDALRLTHTESTRSAGIDSLQQLIREWGEQDFLVLPLARVLSWSGRLEESLRYYDRLVEECAGDECVTIRSERGQLLMWLGRLGAAEEQFERVVAVRPDHAPARVGLARIAGIRGQPLKALAHARAALRSDPGSPDAQNALAQSYDQLGMGGSAGRAAGAASSAPGHDGPGAMRSTRPEVALIPTWTEESSGIERASQRLLFGYCLPGDVRLDLGAVGDRLEQGSTILNGWSGGGRLQWRTPHVRIGGALAAHPDSDGNQMDGQADLWLKPFDGLSTAVRYRYYPLVQPVAPWVGDESSYYLAGSGGAVDILAARELEVGELGLDVQWTPAAWMYTYALGRLVDVMSGETIIRGPAADASSVTKGWTLVSGLGISPAGLFHRTWPVDLYFTAGSFVASYTDSQPAFFSPDFFDCESMGFTLGVPFSGMFRIQAQGGYTFSVESGSTGWYAGGEALIERAYWRGRLRFEDRDELWYRSRRWWLALEWWIQ